MALRDNFDSDFLCEQVNRVRHGDADACNSIIAAAQVRMERIANKMIADFPSVKRWAEAADVIQNASMRLVRAIKCESPTNTKCFYRLTAELIRRELVDLARKLSGEFGIAANHVSHARLLAEGGVKREFDPVDPSRVSDIEKWQLFHEIVTQLPDKIREVFEYRYYHGWSYEQIVAHLELSERTVRRRWEEAIEILRARLSGEWPDSG